MVEDPQGVYITDSPVRTVGENHRLAVTYRHVPRSPCPCRRASPSAGASESVAITLEAVMEGSGEGKTFQPDVGFPFNLFLPIATAMYSHQTRIVGSFLCEHGSLFGMGWTKKWGMFGDDTLQP